MARRAIRGKPTPDQVAVIRRMIEENQQSDWYRRWLQSIPHAVRAYAAAVREAGDQAVAKYQAALELRLKLAQEQRKPRRGA